MDELEQAYRFLYEFKHGKLAEQVPLTDQEIGLIMVLAKELLPATEVSCKMDSDRLSSLLQRIAREDSKWNHALGNALDTFYHQIDLGQENEGIQTLKAFIDICPSRWYRSHAETELNNLES